MGRIAIFAYGLISYVVFLGSFLYAIGFVGNLWVPKTIDGPQTVGLGQALLINALLLGLFAVQHSVMARPGFKRVWTRIIPPAAERSTFVLLTSLILFLIYWLWQPMGGTVWSVQNEIGRIVLHSVFWLGWLIVLVSTFLINHWDLFGLRQVTLYLQGKEYTPPVFQMHSLYRWVRHPIMLGFVIAMWATPDMSVGHLAWALLTTGYILVGIHFEERDLARVHGETYRRYKQQVSMLLPLRRGKELFPEVSQDSRSPLTDSESA